MRNRLGARSGQFVDFRDFRDAGRDRGFRLRILMLGLLLWFYCRRRTNDRVMVRANYSSTGRMESGNPNVESTRELSSLQEGDIVVLTLKPAFLGHPAEEKMARITLELSNSFTVNHRRFSITSGKELVRSDAGKWRVSNSGVCISVPTQEQLDRLPDPDGNYTEAQILRKREKSIALLLDNVKEYLDPNSPEISKRMTSISFLISNEKEQKLLGEIYSDWIDRVERKNEDLQRRLRELSVVLHEASRLAEEAETTSNR